VEQQRAADILARTANAVANMHWCIDNFAAVRADVGDSRHSDWNDFWEVGYKKHKPWAKNTFVPKRLALGTNSMWAPFYHGGPDVPDDRDPPHFRVSAELFGRMLHTLGREYISKDDNRKISAELNKHLTDNVTKVKKALADAGQIIVDSRHQMQVKQHEDMMVQSRQAIEAAALAYRVEMAKQIGLLQEQTEASKAMTPGMNTAFVNARERILSVDVNRRIQLDAEELRLYAELRRVKDSELALKKQVAKMKAECEQEKSRADRLADHSRTVISENETLHALTALASRLARWSCMVGLELGTAGMLSPLAAASNSAFLWALASFLSACHAALRSTVPISGTMEELVLAAPDMTSTNEVLSCGGRATLCRAGGGTVPSMPSFATTGATAFGTTRAGLS
jgi:hypothetical protein